MQNIELQSNNDFSNKLDAFICNSCDLIHISNYYATIEVPVMRAVEFVFNSDPSISVNISYSFCNEGVSFKVESNKSIFNSSNNSEFPQSGSLQEVILLCSLLSDNFEVSSDGKTLVMTFSVRGIDSHEAANRVRILEQYSIPSPTHQYQ